MKKTTRVIVALGLIATGALGLAGLQAFGAPRLTLPTVPAAAAAPLAAPLAADNTQSVDPALEGKVRDMLQKRMGLSATEADKLAKSMAEHMQAVHGDQADEMANACANQADGPGNTGDSNGFGGGMMGGGSGSNGGGMMGGSGGSGGSGMMGGSGGFDGGMMGGGL